MEHAIPKIGRQTKTPAQSQYVLSLLVACPSQELTATLPNTLTSLIKLIKLIKLINKNFRVLNHSPLPPSPKKS